MRLVGPALLAGTLLASVGPFSAVAETYGFGTFLKRNVVVERRLAPEVQLSNVSIDVQFPRGTGGLDGQIFRSQLETDIARGGQNISLEEHNPQFDLRLEVTDFVRPHVDRQTQGKNTTYIAAGSASITFQLIHHTDGRVVFAGTESYAVGRGPSKSLFGLPVNSGVVSQNTTDNSLALELVNHLAIQIASHLVVTAEDVTLQLGRGPGLDAADKLAEAKRWNEYLEALSTMPPAPSPAEDAYRIYDMGVANEALGYAAEDPKTTLKLLREASVKYTEAMEDKRTERTFTECQARIERALTRYTTLEERNKQAAQMERDDQKQHQDYMARKKAGAIDDTDIIRLVQAGVDPSIIVLKIRTAPAADFDLSTDGLVLLSKSGVRANLIAEMTQRMQNPTAPVPAPRPPATGAPVHR